MSARGLLYGARPRGTGPEEIELNLPPKPRRWKEEDQKFFAYLEQAGYIEPGNYSFAQGLGGFYPGAASFEIADHNSADDLTVPVTTFDLRDSDGRLGVTIRHRDERSSGYLSFEPIDRGHRQVNSTDEMVDDLVENGSAAGLDYVEAHLTYEQVKPRLEAGQRLEIVWNEEDEADNSPEKMLNGAREQVNRYRASSGDAAVDQLISELEAIEGEDRGAYVALLAGDETGRKALTGHGGTWVYRILIDRDEDA